MVDENINIVVKQGDKPSFIYAGKLVLELNQEGNVKRQVMVKDFREGITNANT